MHGPQDPDEAQYLAAYDAGRYPRPSLAVDVVLLTVGEDGLRTLLIQRTEQPQLGLWAIPGGFVQMDESLDEAAQRVLATKVGLEDAFTEQLYTFGEPGRDPRTRVISVTYYALVAIGRLEAIAAARPDLGVILATVETDASTGTTHALDANRAPLPLAFDHEHILSAAIERIRGKLDDAPIGFELLPATFTLLELRRVHEAILGRPLNKDSFRRKVLDRGLVEATGRRATGLGHRPPELYRFVRAGASEERSLARRPTPTSPSARPVLRQPGPSSPQPVNTSGFDGPIEPREGDAKTSRDTATIKLASRLAGAVWGHLVGDAVGVPYEFGPPRPADEVVFGRRGSHRQPAGTWSDDGALMLALLDSLEHAPFDPEDQGRRALAWRDDRAYTPDNDGKFDIGNTTRRALDALQSGVPATKAGPTDEHSCGNGSLMRTLPIALMFRDLRAGELIERAQLASRVTHGHPRCQVACAVYCLVIVELLRGAEPQPALDTAMAAARSAYTADPTLDAHRDALDDLEAWTARAGGGFVLDSFWSAWDAFAGAADYTDTIRRAVSYGRDTDTTAAIAGGLAGARWGWESIPLDWRRGMRGREVATPLVDRLVGTTGAKTSTASPLRVDDLSLAGTGLEASGGHIGITFLPGKKREGHTGTHWRDLDLDLAALRTKDVDALFLLVEDVELDWCQVPELPAVMAAEGPELIRFPIRDPRTPTDPVAFRLAIRDLIGRIESGRSVAIACRGGMDRSGMAAACLLVERGFDPDAAIERVQASRSSTITRPEQQDFVRRWNKIEVPAHG